MIFYLPINVKPLLCKLTVLNYLHEDFGQSPGAPHGRGTLPGSMVPSGFRVILEERDLLGFQLLFV